MANLWERMIHIYGHKFASAFGESAFDGNDLSETARTWASGLRDVTGEQIASGLRECVNKGDPWPPALPEFVSMCKGRNMDGFGLGYVPEIYRKETRRDHILESDENKVTHKAAYEAGIGGIRNIFKRGGE